MRRIRTPLALGLLSLSPGCGTATEALARVTGVEQRLSALTERVDALEATVADAVTTIEALADDTDTAETDTDTVPPTGCAEGMVGVGEFCIDTWKASVWDNPTCDGTGTMYGAERPDYPATFPESGDWTEPLYACSLPGVVPAGDLTWFQAAQACALSGKSLCSNMQWQVAVAGTPSDEAACALSSGAPVATGSYPECVSSWGTWDQVGIRWEWTSDWATGGATWMVEADGDSGRQVPWPASYGDGQDYTLNHNGRAMGPGVLQPGLPTAIIRGGDYSTGAEGGSFALSAARGPSHIAPYIGFRCCTAR